MENSFKIDIEYIYHCILRHSLGYFLVLPTVLHEFCLCYFKSDVFIADLAGLV